MKPFEEQLNEVIVDTYRSICGWRKISSSVQIRPI